MQIQSVDERANSSSLNGAKENEANEVSQFAINQPDEVHSSDQDVQEDDLQD